MTTLAGFSVKPDSSGRGWCQLTRDRAHAYPLYYFTPSMTSDSRYLIHHSERSGEVQLYRLDLQTGSSVALTDGHTADAGWGVWCEWRLRGIYNHLSSLNPVKREVYYFQNEEIRCTGLDTLANRQVLSLPGRVPIAQTSFSPDGRHFGFIHADRASLRRELADYEVRRNMDQFDWMQDHQTWRNRIPCTIAIIDTATGAYREVRQLDHYAHHLLFLDNERLLLNHPKNDNGMWTIRLDGSDYRWLRPRDDHGTICHQVVTSRGIFYETVMRAGEVRRNWLGCYDPVRHTFEEVPLPERLDGYVHTGFDPTGKFLFFEHHGNTHELLSLHQPFGTPVLKTLRTLPPYPKHGQRFHAHPFLTPDRNWLIHTEVIEGFAQICALDVRDLVDRTDYWNLR
ncbi:MAG: hypothetical protein K9M98_01460 [Cephaloticoccus sp.]|nr:hypothetical protein [Cephaloticoccus sp.]MCF7759146.1 hypothetical protein [Cephaloticoccus sp.]